MSVQSLIRIRKKFMLVPYECFLISIANFLIIIALFFFFFVSVYFFHPTSVDNNLSPLSLNKLFAVFLKK